IFYEYLIVIEKTEDKQIPGLQFCDVFSETAKAKALEAGYTDVAAFFKDHQQKNP
ncbi:MAG: hypothetical protein H7321_04440, partial [Bacteroidia bacterium]|nr:hypothetical protein [Bacteroidia bacterium]